MLTRVLQVTDLNRPTQIKLYYRYIVTHTLYAFCVITNYYSSNLVNYNYYYYFNFSLQINLR